MKLHRLITALVLAVLALPLSAGAAARKAAPLKVGDKGWKVKTVQIKLNAIGMKTTPRAFDCSGYVQYVFRQHKAQLPRTADLQFEKGLFVTQRQLKPGDLVFFSTYEPGASHVGIYAGNGLFWNATSSQGVRLCSLSDDYWKARYYGAKRVLVPVHKSYR